MLPLILPPTTFIRVKEGRPQIELGRIYAPNILLAIGPTGMEADLLGPALYIIYMYVSPL